jgi:hypothetical protein
MNNVDEKKPESTKELIEKTTSEILADSEKRLEEARMAVDGYQFGSAQPAPSQFQQPPLPPTQPQMLPPRPQQPQPFQQQQPPQFQQQPQPFQQQQPPQFQQQPPQPFQQQQPQPQLQMPAQPPFHGGYDFPTLLVIERLHGLLESYRHVPNVYPEELRQATILEIEKLRVYQQKLRGIPNAARAMVDTVFSQVIMPYFQRGE